MTEVTSYFPPLAIFGMVQSNKRVFHGTELNQIAMLKPLTKHVETKKIKVADDNQTN